jgi:hypothetical protein
MKVSWLLNGTRGEGQNKLYSNAHNIGHERCPTGDSYYVAGHNRITSEVSILMLTFLI